MIPPDQTPTPGVKRVMKWAEGWTEGLALPPFHFETSMCRVWPACTEASPAQAAEFTEEQKEKG